MSECAAQICISGLNAEMMIVCLCFIVYVMAVVLYDDDDDDDATLAQVRLRCHVNLTVSNPSELSLDSVLGQNTVLHPKIKTKIKKYSFILK